MKQAVAVIFGTFAPMHKGHIDLIQRAKRECDRAVVIVSGYKMTVVIRLVSVCRNVSAISAKPSTTSLWYPSLS